MAFSLSPIGNEQQVDSNGAPLSGGLIYTYLAGSTTPAPTYTDNTGGTPQANPIVLNTLGRPASPIWLTDGVSYKFILTSSAGVQQWTIDNITGVSSSTPTQDEWVLQSTVPTYISATQFSVPGDQTATFTVGRRVRAVCTGGVRYGYISVSAFTTLTTVTLVIDSGSLDSGLSAVSVGLLSSDNSSVPWVKTSGSGLSVQGNLSVAGSTSLSGNAASSLQAVPKQQLDSEISTEVTNRNSAISAAVSPATIAPTLFVEAGVQASTSGTSVSFTGIPTWAKRVTMLLKAVSTNGTSRFLVQIGDTGSGSYLSSGYSCLTSGIIPASAQGTQAYTDGASLYSASAAAGAWDARVTFSRLSISNGTWVFDGLAGLSSNSGLYQIVGGVTVVGVLDKIRLTTAGVDTFDAGQVNVTWE